MNVILVSDHMAKTRSIALNIWQIMAMLLLLFCLMFGAALTVQYALVRYAPDGLNDGIRALLAKIQNHELQKQQSYLHSSLDAMASRVGQMQAQMQRLDALGARLAKLSGMKPEEFNFDVPPAQGGPLAPPSAQVMPAVDLDKQIDDLTTLINDRNDKLLALETMLQQNQLSRRLLPSIPPVSEGYYSSNFGWRIDPFTGMNAMHEGVDFVVPEGTDIRASAGGVVAYADSHPQYGKMVEIDHGNDIVTRYAHASLLLVKAGQVVRRGEKIAEVGNTGRSTGDHLHFEVRYKGIAQNPVRFLRKAAG